MGFKLADKVIADFGDTIIVDQRPQLAGKQLSFVIRASGKKPTPIIKPDTPTISQPVTVESVKETKETTNA